MKDEAKLTFHGGAGTVTGANFLFESNELKLLIDCGLQQGGNVGKSNYDDFQYNTQEIDFLIITHAHLDHIGRIPKLIRDGFDGVIYSTPSTKEIAKLIFEDNLHLLRDDARKKGVKPMYEEKDVKKTISLWKKVSYHEKIQLDGDHSFLLKDAGHILGSAMVEISKNNKKIVFTGDLGNSPTPFLRDTEVIRDADYLVMESVYGDRNHENSKEERSKLLQNTIEENIKKKGTLIIPAFSIERTQIILYEINKLVENKIIPEIPVFLDSPLAIKVTDIYREKIKNFKKSVQEEITGGDDIFDFPKLKLTLYTSDSRKIFRTPSPKIIIAGSGMSHGGRIIFHEEKYLPDPNNTILFVGYQVAGNLGRQIQDGVKKVIINDKKITVRANVENISGFSAHKDLRGLTSFVEQMAGHVKQVFVVMGEPKSSLFLVQRLRDYLNVNAVVPKKGDTFTIDF